MASLKDMEGFHKKPLRYSFSWKLTLREIIALSKDFTKG